MPTWIYISIITATCIIGYVVSILIRKTKDATESRKTIIVGSSGISTTSNSQILALCHSLNGQQTSGARKSRRKKRTTTASLIIKESRTYNHCSFTSKHPHVRLYGNEVKYQKKSGSSSKRFQRKHTKGMENIIIDKVNFNLENIIIDKKNTSMI